MTKAEEFIQDYTKNCINTMQCYDEDCNPQVIFNPWLTPEDARKAVEIAREEMIEKACEYLDGFIEILNDNGHGLKKERIIGGLKQAMQDE